MENNLIGKKVKAFEFESSYSCSEMKKYVGEIGTIAFITKAYPEVRVAFSDGEYWFYPLSEIDKHLVNEYPKVMIVSYYKDFSLSKTRVVFMEKKGKFLAWESVETIEEAENEMGVTNWNYAKDIDKNIEPKIQLTLQDISDGKGVGVATHLIEII